MYRVTLAPDPRFCQYGSGFAQGTGDSKRTPALRTPQPWERAREAEKERAREAEKERAR